MEHQIHKNHDFVEVQIPIEIYRDLMQRYPDLDHTVLGSYNHKKREVIRHLTRLIHKERIK